jgi:hypothetical protein
MATSIEELREIVARTAITMEELAEAQKKTELALQETQRVVKETSLKVGGIGNSIGEITELVLLPGLKMKMNEYNHNFTMMSPRKEFFKPSGGNFTEVDLLLENCNEVMIVEVKTDFKPKWVYKLLQRIELLRQNEAITGLKGKTIYAAVAGIHFGDEARDLAAEHGMYLIEANEDYDSEKLVVIPPPNGQIGKW